MGFLINRRILVRQGCRGGPVSGGDTAFASGANQPIYRREQQYHEYNRKDLGCEFHLSSANADERHPSIRCNQGASRVVSNPNILASERVYHLRAGAKVFWKQIVADGAFRRLKRQELDNSIDAPGGPV